MKITLICICVFCSLGLIYGQEDYSHQSTSMCGNTRYEIIQSDIAARGTYKVDKYAGYVWQMVQPKEGRVYWDPIEYEKRPICQVAAEEGSVEGLGVRFQFFTSGFTMAQTYIIDTETVDTWVLYKDSKTDEPFFGSISTVDYEDRF